MTVTQRERFLYDLQGFLVVRDVLTDDEVARLREGIAHHAQDAREDRRVVYSSALDGTEPRRILAGMLGWEQPWSQPFRDLLVHPRIAPYLNAFIGVGWRLDQHPFAILTNKGAEGAVMHGSTGVDVSDGFFYHYNQGRMHSGMIVVEFVLTDHDEGDGGFACIPGSHKANVPCPPEILNWDEDKEVVVQPTVKAGDVVIFNEATLHGTLPWQRDEERQVLLYRYSPKYLTAGGSIAEYVLPAWTQELTDEQRSILRPPTMVNPPVIDDHGVLTQS